MNIFGHLTQDIFAGVYLAHTYVYIYLYMIVSANAALTNSKYDTGKACSTLDPFAKYMYWEFPSSLLCPSHSIYNV